MSAMPEALFLAAGRNLANPIEGVAVCSNASAAVIRLLSVFALAADKTAPGLNHTASLSLLFLLLAFCHREHDNYLSCS